MKKLFAVLSIGALLLTSTTLSAQEKKEDKSKRPSPPAKVSETIKSGATISIDYSQPSVKGRTIGKDLEPKDGATIFETDKAVTINGKALPAGKYSLFSIAGAGEWTIIFNKTWNQWGAYDYKQADDILRVKAKATKAASFAEKMTFTIDKNGNVSLLWGDHQVNFMVK
jgi:hypothetical protein